MSEDKQVLVCTRVEDVGRELEGSVHDRCETCKNAVVFHPSALSNQRGGRDGVTLLCAQCMLIEMGETP